MRRHTTQPSIALGRQLAEWREPLDEDPAVEEAVMRMLQSVDPMKGTFRVRSNGYAGDSHVAIWPS